MFYLAQMQLTIKSNLPRDVQSRMYTLYVVHRNSQVDWPSWKIQMLSSCKQSTTTCSMFYHSLL